MRKHSLRKMIIPILVLLGVMTGTASAYLTAYDEEKNIVSVGSVTSRITEEFPSPTPLVPDKDITYPKTVRVANPQSAKNGTASDCYVRMSLGYSNSDIAGALTLNGLDTKNWVLKEDGFYYYTKILKEGESTTPLFTGFTIKSEKLADEYLDLVSAFELQVYEESVQAYGSSSYQEAWKQNQGSL